jgi:hypothetical protein
MSDRSNVWVVRAGLYGLAGLLFAVVWHWHGADRRERALQQRVDSALVAMTGQTSARETAGLVLTDGDVESLSVALRFRCTPAVANVWATYEIAPDGRADRAAGGVIRIRHHGAPRQLPRGLLGVSDLRVDGRYDVHRAIGTASARLTLTTPAGATRATCRAAPVTFTLAG